MNKVYCAVSAEQGPSEKGRNEFETEARTVLYIVYQLGRKDGFAGCISADIFPGQADIIEACIDDFGKKTGNIIDPDTREVLRSISKAAHMAYQLGGQDGIADKECIT